MFDYTTIFVTVSEAFARAGGCVKRITLDISGTKVTFVRVGGIIGILG